MENAGSQKELRRHLLSRSLVIPALTHRDFDPSRQHSFDTRRVTKSQSAFHNLTADASMTTTRLPLMDISNTDTTSSPAAPSGRRKSGRAVKAPDKFVPDAPSSQINSTSTKRKREVEDAEDDASEADEEAELSDTTIESSGEEEVAYSRRKTKPKSKDASKAKKPAAKKTKTNGTVSHKEVLSVKLPNRPKKAKRVVIEDDQAEGLYAQVFTSEETLEDVASIWLDNYRNNRTTALTELMNFVLKCAGCNVQLTEDDIEDSDNVTGRLQDVQEEYQAQNITDYPLISKARSAHGFRTNLVNFFHVLVQATHESGFLYEIANAMNEENIVDDILHWLSSITSSTSRPFRHTSTVVALAITSSMCAVAKKEADLSAITLRQFESEKKRKGANKARLTDFAKKVKTNEDHKDLVETQIKGLFDLIYIHRYRDVDPKIRLECVEALGNWIVTLKSVFLEGAYLRYMGWMLSDVDHNMRHEVLKQLEKILQISNNSGGMHHFIERFCSRIIEMATRDSEAAVRASALDLLDVIRKLGMLEPDDIDVIGKLIFDSEPKVRKALVGFFAQNINDSYDIKVEELGGEEILEELFPEEDEENFDSPRDEWIRFKCLAEILASYDNDEQEEPSIQAEKYLDISTSESRFTLAAQALYDKISELKEWETLAGYLLYDHSSRGSLNGTERALRDSFKPTEKEEIILLEILNTCVKLSLTHGDESEKSRKKHSRTENSEARENTTRHLATLIPRLLKKFGADPKTVTIVLRLEHVLNLGVFQELRQDSTAYAKLLDEISAQFSGHADKGVLSEAGAALLHARSFEELEELTESKMQSLWENTTGTLQKLNKAGQMAVRANFGRKVLTDLSDNLARLEQLASISSCVEPLENSPNDSGPLPIHILLDIVARGIYEDSNDEALDQLEDEVAMSAIRSSMFYFMWKTRDLLERVSNGDEIPNMEIDQLKEWQDLFTSNLIAAFSSRSSLDSVRLLGAGTILDIYVLFSSLRPAARSESTPADGSRENPYLQTLVQEIIPEVQHELTSIFEGLEKQFAKKSDKKLAEPPEGAELDIEDEPEEEEEEEASEYEKQCEVLKAEKQLCELTGKLVFGIVAQVIDVGGPLAGKLKPRILRNRLRLGLNFKEVLSYLDEPKARSKRPSRAKSQQPAMAKKPLASTERVEEHDEEDEEEHEDPFAEDEPEEGSAGDSRKRELLDEEPDGGEGAEQNGNSDAEANEDIMGE